MEWKGIGYGLLMVLLVLLGGRVSAQQNLVPNPSFEANEGCPVIAGQISLAVPWVKVGGGGSMAYYHECGSTTCGVPINRGGFQFGRTGESYADVIMMNNNHILPFFTEGNFLGTILLDTLEAGQKYNVEFFLSLADSVRFASRNVGVFFSDGQPPSEGEDLVALTPQVRYEGDFLTDKEGWMRIDGSFVAEGGENFMTIGNFDGYHNSDTLNLHQGGVLTADGTYNLGYWEIAWYYIDDVSVVEDTSYHVGIEEPLAEENLSVSVYPNPSTGTVAIECHLEEGESGYLWIHDMAGRIVYQSGIKCDTDRLEVSDLSSGLYQCYLSVNEKPVLHQKLVILDNR